MLADVQETLGRRVAAEIAAAGGCVRFDCCDVSQADQVQASIERAAAEQGGLDVVVQCAGIVHVGLLHDCSESDWDRLMAVNLKSIFLGLKYSLPHLRQNRQSYMVNVASISSFVGQAQTPAYTASKGAVRSLTQSIALDYAALGLRCNCICPGITDTPMLRQHLESADDPDQTLRERVRRVPIRRALQPAEIARTALFLCCEDSAGMTGSSLVVDGGYLAAAEWDALNPPVS